MYKYTYCIHICICINIYCIYICILYLYVYVMVRTSNLSNFKAASDMHFVSIALLAIHRMRYERAKIEHTGVAV